VKRLQLRKRRKSRGGSFGKNKKRNRQPKIGMYENKVVEKSGFLVRIGIHFFLATDNETLYLIYINILFVQICPC